MWRNVSLIFVLGAMGFYACQNPFAPAKAADDLSGSLLLTAQKTPDEVLQNFQYAYTFKDSLVYSEILDSTFIFIGQNFNVSPAEPIVWGRDQELKIAGRMFRFFSNLDLTWNSRPLKNPSPAVTDTTYFRINFTLILDGGSSIPALDGNVTFRFIKRGEKWLLSRWEDETL